MTTGKRCCDVAPRIVRADAVTEITIRPLDPQGGFGRETTYELTAVAMEGDTAGPVRTRMATRPVDGALRVGGRFAGEQEHVLLVESVEGDQRTPVAEARVYSLADDLYARRALKGDFHIHSDRSDGREPPAYVAGACRRIGLDFMAVTDHRLYAPSLEAARAFDGVEVDLRIWPGEEIHLPDNPVHMVNFGGSFSVNELLADEQAYRAEVAAVERETADLPTGERRYQYASCVWCYRKIRQAGGLAIFCHPYWVTHRAYNVPEWLIERHLADRPFDAFELIGGFHMHEAESNVLQVARYHEQRTRDPARPIPVVGVSDAHGCERGELFGWYYTIVLAASPSLPDVIDAVRGCYSVAVEALPGAPPRAHGPMRLVKFAQFLLREVFGARDELCAEEGRLMLSHVAGDPAAARQLAGLKGRTAAMMDRLWGR